MKILAGLLIAIIFAGCGSKDPAPRAPTRLEQDGTPAENVAVTPELLRAFRDEVHAYYDILLIAETAQGTKDEVDQRLRAAVEAEKSARGDLVAALENAGSTRAKDAGEHLTDLVPIFRDALARSGRYAFIVSESKEPSFAVLELVGDPRDRSLDFFGDKFDYKLYLHDRTIVENYPTYRASRLAGSGPAPVQMSMSLGSSVYVDLAAAEKIGRDSFLPRIPDYKKLAQVADDAYFAKEPGDAALLRDVKDLLRWRSLEAFWSTVETLPRDEQVERFVEDFAAREEVQAAAEAHELVRGLGNDTSPVAAKLLAVEQHAMLAAIAKGEPLGETANVVSLAGVRAGMPQAPEDPYMAARLNAAVWVTTSLVRGLPATGNEDALGGTPFERDARAFSRLAHADREVLKQLAASLYQKLPPAAGAKPPG